MAHACDPRSQEAETEPYRLENRKHSLSKTLLGRLVGCGWEKEEEEKRRESQVLEHSRAFHSSGEQ